MDADAQGLPCCPAQPGVWLPLLTAPACCKCPLRAPGLSAGAVDSSGAAPPDAATNGLPSNGLSSVGAIRALCRRAAVLASRSRRMGAAAPRLQHPGVALQGARQSKLSGAAAASRSDLRARLANDSHPTQPQQGLEHAPIAVAPPGSSGGGQGVP